MYTNEKKNRNTTIEKKERTVRESCTIIHNIKKREEQQTVSTQKKMHIVNEKHL